MGDGVFKKRRTCDKPHYENEEPFDIPSSWVWTTINDINMYNSKNVDPAKHKENIFELYSVPVFPTDTPEIVKGEKIGSAKQSVENGDVLLCKINPKINRVWFVKNRTENAMIASSEWIVVRNKFMLTDYLVFCFMSPYFRDLIESNVSGVGGSLTRAQPSMVATYTIPIPPFHEQERIVEEIKHWFELIDVIEHNKEDLQEVIKQTKSKILDLAIHGKLVPQDPSDEPANELLKRINPKAEITCDNPQYGKLPNGWCEVQLGDVFNHNTGKALNASNTEGSMKRYLTTSNVYWNTFDFTTVKQMYYKDSELDKCSITKGDLLVCEGGDVGRAAIWNFNYDICIQNHLHRLRPKLGDLCVSLYYYVFYYLKVNNMIGGKGIGLLGLSSNALHKLHVPLPPINEQHRIVAKIEELFTQLDNITSSV